MTTRLITIVCLTALLYGCSTLSLDRRDAELPIWTTEGRSAMRANATATRIEPPLEMRWDFNASAGFGAVSPLIVGDIVFVPNRKGEVHAIDFDSGRRVGRAEFGEAIEGTPVYRSGTLVVPLAWGGVALHAHNMLRGNRRWRVRGAPVSSGLVADDEVVIAGDVEGWLRAYRLTDGEEVWAVQLEERAGIFSTPVLVDDVLIAANDRGHLAAIDVRDGTMRWSTDVGAPVHVSLAADDDAVYAATTRGSVHALDLETGAALWAFSLGNDRVYVTAPSLGEWEVVVGASDGTVRALDLADGSESWSTQLGDAVSATPLLTDHVVYIGTMGGELLALSREDGRRVWETQLEGRAKSAFAVKDRSLVVLAEPRLVYLFEPTSESYASRSR